MMRWQSSGCDCGYARREGISSICFKLSLNLKQMDSVADPRAFVRALDQVLLLHVLHGQPAKRDAAVEGHETVEQRRRNGD